MTEYEERFVLSKYASDEFSNEIDRAQFQRGLLPWFSKMVAMINHSNVYHVVKTEGQFRLLTL